MPPPSVTEFPGSCYPLKPGFNKVSPTSAVHLEYRDLVVPAPSPGPEPAAATAFIIIRSVNPGKSHFETFEVHVLALCERVDNDTQNYTFIVNWIAVTLGVPLNVTREVVKAQRVDVNRSNGHVTPL